MYYYKLVFHIFTKNITIHTHTINTTAYHHTLLSAYPDFYVLIFIFNTTSKISFEIRLNHLIQI